MRHWWRCKCETYKEHGAFAWVQHTQGFVFAGGENPGSVHVPAGAVDEVGVHAVDPHHRLPTSHVPQNHHVIAACEEEPARETDLGWTTRREWSWCGVTMETLILISITLQIHVSLMSVVCVTWSWLSIICFHWKHMMIFDHHERPALVPQLWNGEDWLLLLLRE